MSLVALCTSGHIRFTAGEIISMYSDSILSEKKYTAGHITDTQLIRSLVINSGSVISKQLHS